MVDPNSAADGVLRVKDRLASVPDRGLGYGLLRHLNPVTSEALDDAAAPQIGFNYLGQFTTGTSGEEGVWNNAPESIGLSAYASSDQQLPAVIDINAATVNDPTGPVVEAGFSYAAGILAEADVRELADLWTQALSSLADYATTTTNVRRSISTSRRVKCNGVTSWHGKSSTGPSTMCNH